MQLMDRPQAKVKESRIIRDLFVIQRRGCLQDKFNVREI